MTIIALDAQYSGDQATVAAVLFDDWSAAKPTREQTLCVPVAADYEPGAFYRRELPALLAMLERVDAAPETVIVDGYVWLGRDRPGLGRRLYDALGAAAAVVGVAKTAFRGNDAAAPVSRGAGRRALYVTAEGLATAAAAEAVRRMHGAHRIPTLLKRVDRLARGDAAPSLQGGGA